MKLLIKIEYKICQHNNDLSKLFNTVIIKPTESGAAMSKRTKLKSYLNHFNVMPFINH